MTSERRAVSRADVAIGMVLTAIGVLITVSPDNAGAGWVSSLVMPTVTLPVIWRRRAPLICAAAWSAGTMLSAIPTFDQVRCGAAIPAALLILYALGTQSERRAATGGLALVLAGMAFLSFTDAALEPDALLFVGPLCVGVWSAALTIRSQNRLAAELSQRSGALECQRQRTAALAVEVERTRVAAHLDVAARSRVPEMIELAEWGKRTGPGNPESEQAVFARIEHAGRESLNEMRGLLGALRSNEPSGRAPLPTLAQLDTLLGDARADGRVVDLGIEGERRPLPEGVELTAYRLVEHALSVIDESGDAPVSVCLRYLDASLELEVTGEVAGVDGTQKALIAARERVSVQGGTFGIRNLERGRTVLRACLPLTAAHG